METKSPSPSRHVTASQCADLSPFHITRDVTSRTGGVQKALDVLTDAPEPGKTSQRDRDVVRSSAAQI